MSFFLPSSRTQVRGHTRATLQLFWSSSACTVGNDDTSQCMACGRVRWSSSALLAADHSSLRVCLCQWAHLTVQPNSMSNQKQIDKHISEPCPSLPTREAPTVRHGTLTLIPHFGTITDRHYQRFATKIPASNQQLDVSAKKLHHATSNPHRHVSCDCRLL